MPPPAVALVGPLCQSVDLWEAADRIVRAFCFGMLYSVTVYASTRTRTQQLLKHVDRLLPERVGLHLGDRRDDVVAAARRGAVRDHHARARHAHSAPAQEYKPIESASSTDDDDDLEAANLADLEPKLADPVAEQTPVAAASGPSTWTTRALRRSGAKLIDLSTGRARARRRCGGPRPRADRASSRSSSCRSRSR